jgi:hypothetical protein
MDVPRQAHAVKRSPADAPDNRPLSRSDGGDAERGQVRSARPTAHWDHDAYYGPGWTEPEPVGGDWQDRR